MALSFSCGGVDRSENRQSRDAAGGFAKTDKWRLPGKRGRFGWQIMDEDRADFLKNMRQYTILLSVHQ